MRTLVLLTTLAAAVACSNGPDSGTQCKSDADCSATVCMTETCVAGTCEPGFTAAGTPTSDQTDGNCQLNECDGSGHVVSVADNSNVPAAVTCQIESCVEGAPNQEPTPIETACGTGLICDGGGKCVGCTVPDQCPGSDTECQQRTCAAETCGVQNTAANTPTTSQSVGTCHENVCDGSGNIISIEDDGNVPVDGNVCTADECLAGVPSNPDEPEGFTCGSASASLVCDGSGTCVGCNQPSDCPGSDTDCIVRSCTDNACGSADVGSGTPLPDDEQQSGTCQDLVCNGSGGVTSVEDDSNLPTSTNPCLQDVCTAGIPSMPNQPDGFVCDANNDVCDAIDGVGTCLPPLTGSAGQTWQPAAGWTGGVPCADGIRFNFDGSFVWGCSTTAGFFVAANAGGGSAETFAASNTGLDNLAGVAIGVHSAVDGIVLFSSSAAGSNNWYMSGNSGASWTAHPIDDTNGVPRTIASSRFQQMVGGLWTTFDDVAGQAVVLTGATTPTATHPVTFSSANPAVAATGTARAIVPGMGGGTTDLLLAVFGQQPSGASGTGGVFKGTTKGAVWNESDNGIAASDKNLVFSIIGAADIATSGVAYVALQGGGQIYKTTDDGAMWTQANSGLPTGANVNAIAVDASNTSVVYAATSNGLWESSDGAATWQLAGFSGRNVLAVTVSPLAGDDANVFVGVNDDVGVYAPAP
jgi:hypothetical protein